ncbi:MAG: helix-turn-helix domain-containing protein [Micromonosporaceae bacterium]|nr:helix-turn-helix domain-containing protein [Micromonosporaceae bacterium]
MRIGDQLRVAREKAGVTLAQLAARTSYSRSYLCNVEAGRKTAGPAVVLAYERGLRDEMKRRGLLTGVAAGIVAPAAASELLLRGFAAALDGRKSEDEWRHRADEYGRDYMELGAPELQDKLSGDMIVLQQHLETPALWGTAAKLMTLWGKVSGGPRESIRWYRFAGDAADRSEDDDLRVWVRGRAAIALAYEGAALPVARTFAQHALDLSDKPSLGALNARLALGHAVAIQGDVDTAARELEQAKRVFDVAASEEQVSDFAVPEWRMAIMLGLGYARLGDERRALTEHATVKATIPKHLVRFDAHMALHQGLLMARAGDKPAGLAYAKASLDKLAPEKRSQSLWRGDQSLTVRPIGELARCTPQITQIYDGANQVQRIVIARQLLR